MFLANDLRLSMAGTSKLFVKQPLFAPSTLALFPRKWAKIVVRCRGTATQGPSSALGLKTWKPVQSWKQALGLRHRGTEMTNLMLFAIVTAQASLALLMRVIA